MLWNLQSHPTEKVSLDGGQWPRLVNMRITQELKPARIHADIFSNLHGLKSYLLREHRDATMRGLRYWFNRSEEYKPNGNRLAGREIELHQNYVRNYTLRINKSAMTAAEDEWRASALGVFAYETSSLLRIEMDHSEPTGEKQCA